MWKSQYSEMFISTYMPTYKENSLRKSLHNHRCYFGFTFVVRFCHAMSRICIAISECGSANSKVNKSKAFMCWFSHLIRVSLGGFDENCTDSMSTLQNSITYIKKCHSESNQALRSPMFPGIETAIPSFRYSRCRCTRVLHFWLVIGSRI